MSSSGGDAAAPVLSILCLTYQHEAFVGATIESFIAQRTCFEIEVVVGDDCSSDGTLAVVERYRAALGDRLRVLRTPLNLGVTRNFRRTLQACRGRYVAMCEGDDFWRGTDKLQAQVDFLEAHPNFVMCFHDATVLGPAGDTGQPQLPRRLQRDASRAELIATRPISTLTVCFRNVLGELPPELDQAPALDLCLWSLLGQHGAGKYLGGIEPAAYRVHAGGLFSTQNERSRYMMTAQSLLSLARVYHRQGQAATGNRLLFKAALMACRRLAPGATVAMIGALAALLLLRPARRLWLLLRGQGD